MQLRDYLKQKRGRLASLAKAIGAHAPDVSRWSSGKRPIPEKYGAPIEAATDGAVTRKEMFPDNWQTIWPELDSPCSSTPKEYTPDESGNRKEQRRKLRDRRKK